MIPNEQPFPRHLTIAAAIFSLSVCGDAPGHTTPAGAFQANPVPLVLDAPHFLDGTGAAPRTNVRIIVNDARISCIGNPQSCPTPPQSDHIALPPDAWVLPGLIDAHVHFAQTGWFEGRPDTLDLRDVYPFDETQRALKEDPSRAFRSYLCSGVTGVFDVGGFSWSWDLRAPAENNPLAPHVAAAGPLITHAPRADLNLPGEQEMIALTDAEAGRRAVRYMAAFETDAIKVWFLRVAEEDRVEIDGRVVAVADEARKKGVPLIVHATSLREAKVALREGVHLLVHGVDDQIVDEEFLELAKQAGTIYSPTLLVSDGYLRMFEAVKGVTPAVIDDPNHCVDPETRRRILSSRELINHPSVASFERDFSAYRARLEESYERKIENLRLVHRAGIPIAMGTDAGNPGTLHGPSIYSELEAMQAAGIEADELLVMATQNGARAMGREDIGVVRSGNIADLIVLERNPLEDIKHLRTISHVMRGGNMIEISELAAESN